MSLYMENLIMKVFSLGKNKQKLVTIPKNYPIEAGDYVFIKKVENG